MSNNYCYFIRNFLVCQIIYDNFSYTHVMLKIGKIIKELRTESHLKQSDLAEQLNTTQDTISLWELDKSTPDAENIIKLAKLFKVSADYLLGIEE